MENQLLYCKNKSKLWTDKYNPTNISDLIINENPIKSIINWLNIFEINKKKILENLIDKNNKKTKKPKSFTPSTKSSVLVTGNNGIGKTVSINIMLKEKGYQIKNIILSELKNLKDIEGLLNNSSNSKSVLDIIKKENNKPFVLVIDEIESITSNNEKKAIQNIQKINNIKWFIPIIFISNNKHNKFLNEIKKSSLEIKFYNPTRSDMEQIMSKIFINEKMKFQNESSINKVLEHSQNDIRRLILLLQELKYQYYDKKIIEEEDIDNFLDYSYKKDSDENLYESTNDIFKNYKNIDECIRNYEIDKVLTPLMIHYNFPNHICKNILSIKKKLDITDDLFEMFSFGDVVENYIFENQEWDMHKLHGFMTCVYPSYILNNNRNDKDINLMFTTDPNKTSIRQINKKNIDNCKKCFEKMGIIDFLYIDIIVKKILDSDDIENNLIDLFDGYNIQLEHIESLLKIDKISYNNNVNNNSLTSKQKNKIKSIIEKKKIKYKI